MKCEESLILKTENFEKMTFSRLCFPLFQFNLSMVKGGKITPQADLLAAILEPHETNQNALVTFPKYGWGYKVAQSWHLYCHPEIQDGGPKVQVIFSKSLKNL